MKQEEIQKLKEQVVKLEGIVTYYQKVFQENGGASEEEQNQINTLFERFEAINKKNR